MEHGTIGEQKLRRWTAKRRVSLVLAILRGNTSSLEAVRKHYLPGMGLSAPNGWRLFDRDNALGSIVGQTLNDGSTHSRSEYDAYGIARYGGPASNLVPSGRRCQHIPL